MRRLTYLVATSLDGFIAGPDGDVSRFLYEGDHIDALVRELPETLSAPARAALGLSAEPRVFDTVLMGFATYDVGLRAGVPSPYPHLRQHVFSRTHAREVVGDGVRVHGADPRAVVRALRDSPGDRGIWLCGGGALAASLVDEIDELVMKVHPVILGAGIRVFESPAPAPRAFSLVASRRFASGVVTNTYARA